MDLLDGMESLRCLQTWGFLEFEDNSKRFLKKSSNFPYNRYKTYVSLSLECYRHGSYAEGMEYLEKADLLSYDSFMMRYEKSFRHVSKASRVYHLYKTDQKRMAEALINELRDESITDVDEAGFLFLRASFSMNYGKQGSYNCVEWLKKAIEIVEDEAVFHGQLSSTLTRIRHYEYHPGPPTDEELFHLHKAISYDCNQPWFSINLARLYIDLSYHSSPKQKDDLEKKAMQAYRNALDNSDLLTGTEIASCVYHIMKRDPDPKLEEFAVKAKQMSNAVCVNHHVGLYYLWMNKRQEALECLEEASEFLPYIGGLTLLLKYRTNDNHISERTINEFLSNAEMCFKDRKDLGIFYVTISEFYLLVMKDLKKAAIFFKKFLDTDPDLRKGRTLTLTKRFKQFDYVGVIVKQLDCYNDSDPEVINVKNFVTSLRNRQEIKSDSSPPLHLLIFSLY